MKKVCLLGASGSIGTQTVDIIRQHDDLLQLSAVSVGYNVDYLDFLLQTFETIKDAYLLDNDQVISLSTKYPNVRFHVSIKSLLHKASYDTVINAIIGFAGVEATIEAVKLRKEIGLANKESLVVAGHIVMPLIKEYGVKLFPIDSEHSAIFQSLQGSRIEDINQLIITASGGSFRDLCKSDLHDITVQQALQHPNWSMGAKITIDSATMFNKGLEVIEAMWLFDIELDKIKVVLHYDSIVHSMVQFNDMSIISEMSYPDMKQPIQYALLYPKKCSINNSLPLDFSKPLNLAFKPMDFERFSALSLAYEAARIGHSMPCVLNAAKEAATDLFLDNKLSFLDIERMVAESMENHILIENPNFDQLQQIDQTVRQTILNEVKK